MRRLWWCFVAVAAAPRGYAVLSRRRRGSGGGAITFLRNPKTATTAFLYGVAPLRPCAGRLRVAEAHELGCTSPACESETGIRGIFPSQRAAASAAAAGDRVATLREPVDRFRSAWYFLRAKHPGFAAWARYPCASDLAAALGAFPHSRTVEGRVAAVAAVIGEKNYKAFALWPQAYWLNPVLGASNGSAAIVCYRAASFLKDAADALEDAFGCAVGAAANATYSTNTRATALARAPAAGGCATDDAAADAAVHRFYADDVASWAAYCEDPPT